MPLDPRFAPLVHELRTLLAELRITQTEVEKRAGWTPRYFSRIVNGHVDMKLDHLYDVLDAIGVTPKELFSRAAGVQPSNGLGDILRRLERLERAAGVEKTPE